MTRLSNNFTLAEFTKSQTATRKGLDNTPGEEHLANAKELFENVVIEFEEETFKGKYAIYTRDDNIIKLTGDVSIESPTRLLTGNELIADIDNNKRILNSANKESLVEVLLENNADD